MKSIAAVDKPDWARNLSWEDEVFLNMTPVIEAGLEPLPMILRWAEEMRPCQCFHLLFDREPNLICQVLEEKGFDYYKEFQEGAWNVYFKKRDYFNYTLPS